MNILDEKINESKTICILGHMNPDGDCIGSVLSIYNYIIAKFGTNKIVKIFLYEFSDKYLILPNADKIIEDFNDATKFDLCIVCDCGSTERFKDFIRYFDESKIKIVFDHHEGNSIKAEYSFVFPEKVSTCEILYDYLDTKFINQDIAKCLYIGIATDSGIFRYKATTKETMEKAGKLIDFGFDFSNLLDHIVFDNTFKQRKIQAIVFERMVLFAKGKVSFSYVLESDLEDLNLNKNDIDNIPVYMREICGVSVAAFCYPSGNNIYKFSLRSKTEKYNVYEFAKMHDGGGHILASGCMFYGNIETVTKHFKKCIEDFIDNNEK